MIVRSRKDIWSNKHGFTNEKQWTYFELNKSTDMIHIIGPFLQKRVVKNVITAEI